MTITQSESYSAAWAGGEDAVRAATAEAVERLGGSRPALVVFFADARRPPDQVIEQAVAGSGGARLAGMSASGVMTEDGFQDGGCSAMAFGGEGFAVGIGVAREASRDLRAAGSAAAAAAV
ncbi:MAG: hypothetical protein H0V26_05495, partial [Solirubrobacterales bacterium]|nr:hypothetical protein [Solirubrobacterales bacterium]